MNEVELSHDLSRSHRSKFTSMILLQTLLTSLLWHGNLYTPAIDRGKAIDLTLASTSLFLRKINLLHCKWYRTDDDDDDVQWFNVHLKAG